MPETPPSFYSAPSAPLYFPYDVLFEARRDTFPLNTANPEEGTPRWLTLVSLPSFVNLQAYENEENQARDAILSVLNSLYETEGQYSIEDIARAFVHAVSALLPPPLQP